VGTGAKTWRDAGYDGKGVKVAILDGGTLSTGTYASRVLLASNQTYVQPANTGTTAYVSTGATSLYTNQHGHWMAELIAGEQGIASGATLLVGVISSTTGSAVSADITLAAGWAADQGAKVINASFEYGGILAPEIGVNAVNGNLQLQQAMANIIGRDALLVHASSNSGENISTLVAANNGTYFKDLLYTGAKNNVLIVGALNSDGTRLSSIATAGSNTDVQSRFIMALGVGTIPDGSRITGASVATAHVSGAAALLQQRWPTLGGGSIGKILLDTANRSYVGYSASSDGMGKMDLVKAFTPQGHTTVSVTSVTQTASLASAAVTLPSGVSVSTAATTAILDGYGRDFQIPISGFFRNMSDMRFSQFQSYLTGLDLQITQQGITINQLAGDAQSVIQVGSVGFVSGVRGRYGERTALLPYLSDRTLFDGLAQSSHWYSGVAVGDWQAKQFLAGDDVNGQVVGSAIRYKPSSGMFAQVGVATGHLSGLNQLGMMQGLEMGWQQDGITLKMYDQHLHLQDDLLLKGSDIRTSGVVLGQEWRLGNTLTLGWLARHEENSGYLDMRLAMGQDLSGNMLLSDARVGLTGARNELGVSMVYGAITAMGLTSDTSNHGVLFAYRKGF
jgi:hypothetical protein